MNKLKQAIAISALGAFMALPALAGVSPHETTSATIGDAKAGAANLVKITYGRPFSTKPGTDKPRKIWGGLVKWDKADRLGADQCTTLVLEKPVVLGGTDVPAGTYRLYIIASEKGTSKLAINKTAGVWGIQGDGTVDEKNDLARVDLKKEALDKDVNQLTISVVPGNAEGSGVIKIAWEKTQFSVEFINK